MIKIHLSLSNRKIIKKKQVQYATLNFVTEKAQPIGAFS